MREALNLPVQQAEFIEPDVGDGEGRGERQRHGRRHPGGIESALGR